MVDDQHRQNISPIWVCYKVKQLASRSFHYNFPSYYVLGDKKLIGKCDALLAGGK